MNLYYPVYKKLENEILELTSSIHFTDDQLDVYSLKIAELILRCSVEIESISKDIYRNVLNEEPKNPGTCFTWMEENWHISKKEVFNISPFFYIQTLKVIKPFDYKTKSTDDFYSSYCSIKHDRDKNLKKANINTLIRSLAALYILNLYYNNERYYLNDDHHAKKLDKSAGSQIFIFSVAPSPDNILYTSEQHIIPENCIYKITRIESEYTFKIIFKNINNQIETIRMLNAKPEYQEELKANIGKQIDENFLWNFHAKHLNDDPILVKENCKKINKIKEILSIHIEQMKPAFWAELNI